MRFDKRVKGFVCAVMALLLMVLTCESASAADLKEQEKQELIRAGFEEVTVQEIEKIGIDYYNNRNRYSEPVKVFCEGPLNSALEELYTTNVNCYDSYEECAMAAFIQYKKRSYYVTYSFDVEFAEVRQGLMTDTQYEMAKDKAKQLSYEFNYGTTYDKIDRTYRWICNNMEYDDTLSKGSAYDALILGNTVCTGYASAFQLIMEQMGIESYLVQGKIDGEGHEWNAVKLDDKYYFVDATFGDTSGQLNKYLLFGTDRRKNETYLDITTKSRYFSIDDIDNMTDEEAAEILMVFGIIAIVFILIIVLIIVLCLNHDKKKKRKMRMMQQNGYYNPYGGPAPGMMGGSYANGGPYNGGPYANGRPYNGGSYVNGNPYNSGPYANGNPYNSGSYANGNPYNSGPYAKSNPYNSGPYANGNPNSGNPYRPQGVPPYGNPNSGNPYGSNGNNQYGGSPYTGGQYGGPQSDGQNPYNSNPNTGGAYGNNANSGETYGSNANAGETYGDNANSGEIYGSNPNASETYGGNANAGNAYSNGSYSVSSDGSEVSSNSDSGFGVNNMATSSQPNDIIGGTQEQPVWNPYGNNTNPSADDSIVTQEKEETLETLETLDVYDQNDNSNIDSET